MHRPFVPFSVPEPLTHTRSSADFITITCGFRFTVHTGCSSSSSRLSRSHQLRRLFIISAILARRVVSAGLRVSRRLGVFTTERKTPRMTPARLLFRVPFPALWSAPVPVQARVREYGRDSGLFRGCRLVSNQADALSCRSLLQ